MARYLLSLVQVLLLLRPISAADGDLVPADGRVCPGQKCSCDLIDGKANLDSPWCSEGNGRLRCSLFEVEKDWTVPDCRNTVGKCPKRNRGYTFYEPTGRCYALNRIALSWVDAQIFCQQKGGDLVQLTKEANDYVKAYYANFSGPFAQNTWIGLTDVASEGTFKWIGKGLKPTYVNWANDRPSRNKTNNCVEIQPGNGMKWNDIDCNVTKRVSLCETEFLSPCASNPCIHGDCFSNSTKWWECKCHTGYMGVFCDHDDLVTRCSPVCANDGNCTQDDTSVWRCTCAGGWYGPDCSDKDECFSNPCNVGGVCKDGVNGYDCQYPVSKNGTGAIVKNGKTNLQPRRGITSLLSVFAILWVYYDRFKKMTCDI